MIDYSKEDEDLDAALPPHLNTAAEYNKLVQQEYPVAYNGRCVAKYVLSLAKTLVVVTNLVINFQEYNHCHTM